MSSPFTDFIGLTKEKTENIDPSFNEFESNSPFNERHQILRQFSEETNQISDGELEQGDEENVLNEENEYEEADGYVVISKEIAEVIEQQATATKSPIAIAKSCIGHTCWAKTILNRELGLSLKPDNLLDVPMKKALGNFQAKNKLLQTQQIDFATERALLESDALRRHQNLLSKVAAFTIISAAKARIEDWTKMAINNKPKLILNSYRDPRKVYAFVLHHMAFKRKNRKTGKFSDPNSYLRTGAHYCIMFDGRIIQLHPLSRMIWHAQCISPRSVSVEFEGNFPNIKGKWWINKKTSIQNKDKPTQAQIDSGRFLVSYLKIVLGTTHILAHRQSSNSRENDPGPDIWYYVGQWAIDRIGLTDGGPSFKCGTGNPILPQWRTWGTGSGPAAYHEQNDFIEQGEWEEDDNELEIEKGQDDEPYDEEQRVDIDDEDYNLPVEDDFSGNEIDEFVHSRENSEGYSSSVSAGYDNEKEIEEEWEGEIDKDQQGEDSNDEDYNLSVGDGFSENQIDEFVDSQEDSEGYGSPVASAGSNPSPQGSLGKLTVNTSISALKKSYPSYQFTTDDALWLARFVEGEAGGRDNANSHAVIWAMFNRFGMLRHRVSSWTSFAVFLKKYSTTLQPLLNSVGAAERVWASHTKDPDRNPIVSSQETYPGTNIKKVQYLRHIKLQSKAWSDFKPYVRNMVTRIINGQIPNPGIGIATHFLSTNILLKAKRRKQALSGEPSYEEWRQYTLQFAKGKKMIWIGEQPNLDQRKNAFFIQAQLKDVTSDAVKVELESEFLNAGDAVRNESENQTELERALWQDDNELDSYEADEENFIPEFENFSLTYKIDKIKDWVPLLVFKVPDAIVSRLRSRNMYIQYAHNASYSNDLNVDFYRLRIFKFPMLNGVVLTPESLVKYIRLNINRLVDTSLCNFFPYHSDIDKPVWNSDNPTMAVLKLNIKGPDNASVVVSLSKPRGWRFTTIKSPNMGSHPVSGHREFFIGTDSVTRGTYFVIKGLDMMSTGVAGLGLPFMGAYGFGVADALWKSMRSKVIQFINSNGGLAKEDLTYSERVGWRYVFHSYKNLLANTFGKGAGSAANSSFIN